MNCMLCGGSTRHRFSHNSFDLYWCERCDFGRLAGDFTPEQVATFYPDDYYTHSNEGQHGDKRSLLLERALLHLAWRCDRGSHIAPSETIGKSICDIGCGNGENLRAFQQAGYRTVGVEPDSKARSVAANVGYIIPGTAEDLLVNEKFDVVLMSHVLEHCIDPVQAVRNAAAILDERGTVIIEVPNNSARGFDWFKGKWPWTDIPRHLSFFTEGSLRKIVAKAGLGIDKAIYVGYARQFTPDWRGKIPSSLLSGWPLLVATAMSPERSKYDSIRVHAKRVS